MVLLRNGYAAVLLLALTPGLVFASLQDKINTPEALAEMMVSSLQDSWIGRMNSVVRASESTCADEVQVVTQAIQANETWAMYMLDASSKIQSGILKGNVRDLGMYDECLAAAGQYNGINIQGKHCTVAFSSLSSALCVPSSCNETQIAEMITEIIQNVTVIAGIELELEISGVTCVQEVSDDFTFTEILTIFFFAAVGFFIISCTICEFVKYCRPAGVSPIINTLSKFSLYTNIMIMMSTKVSPQMMPAIQGMRFLSMCWVVLGHRYVNTLTRPLVNTLDILEWYNSWIAVYVQAAPFAVDTFFVISGFLMTYLFLKSKQSGKRSNYPMMYIHRYLRLTPCVAVLILFVAVLLHRVANGPAWSYVLTSYVGTCRKNWWLNLLYVQNLVKVDEMCLPHSWYLAVDMQLFWISPFILYPLHRWPKCGLGILCLLLIASAVTPAVVLVVKDYTNAVLRLDGPRSEILHNFNHFYIPTYNRACAYFVGILLGYDAAKMKRNFSQVTVVINWIVAISLLLLCGLATQRIYNMTYEYNVVLETALAVLLRPCWSIAIAWIVYACSFGYGGAVTRFLSLPIFLPLSRLSYCIYLVHMVIQAGKASAGLTPGRFSDFILFNEFWGDIVVSIGVAFVFSLFFESPVIILEKMLTNRGRKPTPLRDPKKDVEGGIDNKGMTMET